VSPWSWSSLRAVSSFTVISTDRYFRLSPWTIAWLIRGNVLRLFSRFCGATFFPPAVTMMSFLRSVIRTKPEGSISPMSPECSHPSGSIISRVASGAL